MGRVLARGLILHGSNGRMPLLVGMLGQKQLPPARKLIARG